MKVPSKGPQSRSRCPGFRRSALPSSELPRRARRNSRSRQKLRNWGNRATSPFHSDRTDCLNVSRRPQHCEKFEKPTTPAHGRRRDWREPFAGKTSFWVGMIARSLLVAYGMLPWTWQAEVVLRIRFQVVSCSHGKANERNSCVPCGRLRQVLPLVDGGVHSVQLQPPCICVTETGTEVHDAPAGTDGTAQRRQQQVDLTSQVSCQLSSLLIVAIAPWLRCHGWSRTRSAYHYPTITPRPKLSVLALTA